METIINIQLSAEMMDRKFLEALRSRTLPSEFLYWGKEETQQWLKVCHSKQFDVYKKGLTLIQKSFRKITQILEKRKDVTQLNLISLGVGNGAKDNYIIQELSKLCKLKYFPVDISLDMLHYGLASMDNKKIETSGFISNFKMFAEISQCVRQDQNAPHFISLLGNTLGNFGQVEILNGLRQGMEADDYLLLEVTMRKESGSKLHGEDVTPIVQAYNNEDYRNFIFSPLLKAGFSRSDGVIEVEYGPHQFYPKLYSIEIWFHLTKDKVARYKNEEIVFKKDERILLVTSHKYTSDNIKELLDGNGFEVVHFALSEDGNSGLILSQLKE